jgi:hypothetical protein
MNSFWGTSEEVKPKFQCHFSVEKFQKIFGQQTTHLKLSKSKNLRNSLSLVVSPVTLLYSVALFFSLCPIFFIS